MQHLIQHPTRDVIAIRGQLLAHLPTEEYERVMAMPVIARKQYERNLVRELKKRGWQK